MSQLAIGTAIVKLDPLIFSAVARSGSGVSFFLNFPVFLNTCASTVFGALTALEVLRRERRAHPARHAVTRAQKR